MNTTVLTLFVVLIAFTSLMLIIKIWEAYNGRQSAVLAFLHRADPWVERTLSKAVHLCVKAKRVFFAKIGLTASGAYRSCGKSIKYNVKRLIHVSRKASRGQVSVQSGRPASVYLRNISNGSGGDRQYMRQE